MQLSKRGAAAAGRHAGDANSVGQHAVLGAGAEVIEFNGGAPSRDRSRLDSGCGSA
jgi:hypothetical protein